MVGTSALERRQTARSVSELIPAPNYNPSNHHTLFCQDQYFQGEQSKHFSEESINYSFVIFKFNIQKVYVYLDSLLVFNLRH